MDYTMTNRAYVSLRFYTPIFKKQFLPHLSFNVDELFTRSLDSINFGRMECTECVWLHDEAGAAWDIFYSGGLI